MRARFFTTVLIALFTHLAYAQSKDLLPESPGALEYKRVSEALDAVRAKPGVIVNVTKPDGWVIINDGKDVMWSFTPVGHYAHPAVVRRALVLRSSGGLFMDMRALCEAQKEPCDRLIREFQQLNDRMRESVQQELKQRQ